MTFEELKTLSQSAQSFLEKIAREFPWENREAYAAWLAQSHEYASFSTRILALTAGHFPLSQTAYSTRFIQHAAEEKGHDRLLLNDARALGLDLMALKVLPEAEAFHKSLYFWIYQGKPSVILGWVLCLECFAVRNGAAIFERVSKAHGSKAASFLRVHANEDVDHVEKAFATVQTLSAADLEDVAHGIELYSQLYARIYQALEAIKNDSLLRAA